MMYSYLLVDDKYEDLLFDILRFPIFPTHIASAREEMKKVDESNFFTIFYEFTRIYPVKDLKVIDLERFFTLRTSKYYENEKDFNDTYVTINFKKIIRDIVTNLQNKKINSKQVLINKLLEIKEDIIEFNLPMLNYIIVILSDYCDLDEGFEESKKIHFLLNIIDALIDYEDELFKLIDDTDIKINSLSITKKGNYKVKADRNTLLKIYNNLEKNDFIDIDKTSSKNFIDVFKLDFELHEFIVDLNMDKIQFNYFIKLFDDHLKSNIPLALIEYAGNITTKGKKISASVIYSSASRNKMGPKRQEILESIFL